MLSPGYKCLVRGTLERETHILSTEDKEFFATHFLHGLWEEFCWSAYPNRSYTEKSQETGWFRSFDDGAFTRVRDLQMEVKPPCVPPSSLQTHRSYGSSGEPGSRWLLERSRTFLTF